MQRTFVAIAFALALTCAFAGISTTNYVKPPVQVVPDADTNFTNVTAAGTNLALVPISGDLYVVSSNVTANTANLSASNWQVWMKKIATKDLSISSNTSITFSLPPVLFFANNYIYSLFIEKTGDIVNWYAYQVPLNGGAALPRVTLTTNTNATFGPTVIGAPVIGKVAYIFYLAADKKVNMTSFTIGGAAGSSEYTITTAYQGGFQAVWGEALPTSQVFATWMEADVLKEALIDVTKGTATPTAVGAWNSAWICQVYTTDKKYYGEFCRNSTGANVTYAIRTNTTSLVNFTQTYNKTVVGVYPYGPYIAVFYVDAMTTVGTRAYSYDIWNLDTLATFKNNTPFLTADGTSQATFGRVPAGGIYTITWTPANTTAEPPTTVTGISVGLVLGASSLTTIFGALVAIVASLFLF